MHSTENHQSPRFISFAAAVLLLSLSPLGCKVDGAAIGEPCSSDSDCSSLVGGYCTPSGICSRPCQTHQDCGCNVDGVTTDDIAGGACDTSCDFANGACMRLCTSSAECANAAICGSYDGYPYATCW